MYGRWHQAMRSDPIRSDWIRFDLIWFGSIRFDSIRQKSPKHQVKLQPTPRATLLPTSFSLTSLLPSHFFLLFLVVSSGVSQPANALPKPQRIRSSVISSHPIPSRERNSLTASTRVASNAERLQGLSSTFITRVKSS